MVDIAVTYKEFDEVLELLKFSKEQDDSGYVYSYPPLNAKIKIGFPNSPNDLLNGGILSGHAFLLEQKGVITKAKVFFRIIENQRFIKENVLV
jgi:hypothetical protein